MFGAVGCFVECKSSIIELLHQDTSPYPGKWGFPGGKIKQGESPVQAVKREVQEETGIINFSTLKFLQRYYVTHIIKGKKTSFIYHMFHLKLNEYPHIRISAREHIRHAWATPVQALQLNLIEDSEEIIKMFYRVEKSTQ